MGSWWFRGEPAEHFDESFVDVGPERVARRRWSVLAVQQVDDAGADGRRR